MSIFSTGSGNYKSPITFRMNSAYICKFLSLYKWEIVSGFLMMLSSFCILLMALTSVQDNLSVAIGIAFMGSISVTSGFYIIIDNWPVQRQRDSTETEHSGNSSPSDKVACDHAGKSAEEIPLTEADEFAQHHHILDTALDDIM